MLNAKLSLQKNSPYPKPTISLFAAPTLIINKLESTHVSGSAELQYVSDHKGKPLTVTRIEYDSGSISAVYIKRMDGRPDIRINLNTTGIDFILRFSTVVDSGYEADIHIKQN